MRIFKTNLTTKCFAINYTESTKLMCRNSEEGLNLLEFRQAFTSLALSSTSARKILWATHWWVTQLICCSWYVSGKLQEASCLLTLGLTYVQLKNPWRPELGVRHRTRQFISRESNEEKHLLSSLLCEKNVEHYFYPTFICLDTDSTF